MATDPTERGAARRGYPCCECCLTDTLHPDHHVVPCPTCNNPIADRLRAEVERLTQQIEAIKMTAQTCAPTNGHAWADGHREAVEQILGALDSA